MSKTIIVGKCIYCGTRDSLSREHIVPYGLNGEWVLQQASCLKCAKITSAFEKSILQGLLPQARAALKFRTRHGHPQTFPAVMEIAGQNKVVNLTPEEYGAVVLFPLFRKPAYLDNRQHIHNSLDILGTIMQRINGVDVMELHSKYNAKSIDFRFDFNPTDFLRLLAKIAYGFTVWSYGLEALDQVYVLPIILGQAEEVDKWIGGEPASMGSEEVSVGLFEKDKEVVAKIRLFGKREVPTYIVVVGKLK